MKFWDLPYEDRKKVANNRMRGDRWLVYDYTPSKDGEFGIVEKFPKSIDHGFIHGYVFKEQKAFSVVDGYSDFEINVNTDCWYEDEEFESRTIYPYHIFTSYDKAVAYADKVKENNKHIITEDELIKALSRYNKDVKVGYGKRGYENVCNEYRTIYFDGGWCTAKISNNMIRIQYGQRRVVVIPHLDLLPKAFEKLDEYGYPNKHYSYDSYMFDKFYKELFEIK